MDYKTKICCSIVRMAQNENVGSKFNIKRFNNKYQELVQRLNTVYSDESLNIAIVGYVNESFGQWDPSNIQTGLPGSEECVVYASKELANRGHRVTVYMDPPEDSVWNSPFSNPSWLNANTFDNNNIIYDIIILWRFYASNKYHSRAYKVFGWYHDGIISKKNAYVFPEFDGVLLLSNYHLSQFNYVFVNFHQMLTKICGNGVLHEQFENPMNITNNHSIGYFSNYARGLYILLKIWPNIINIYPDATLDICYGRQTWGTMSNEDLNTVVELIEKYKSIGVTEHGKIGHQALADIMQQTSIWAYPCNELGESETFCITAVKCQLAGCIPVTTRIGALNETVHLEAPFSHNLTSNGSTDKYQELLLNTLARIDTTNPEIIKEEREKYIAFAKQWSWSSCIDKWLELYDEVK
jgi:glycosyltransferase involved in cell wall biosynthesis